MPKMTPQEVNHETKVKKPDLKEEKEKMNRMKENKKEKQNDGREIGKER